MAKEIETERCRVSARNPLREFLDVVRTRSVLTARKTVYDSFSMFTRFHRVSARSFLRKLLDVRDDFLGELAGSELLGVLELAL